MHNGIGAPLTRHYLTIDPETNISKLLLAIPSSAAIFERFGLQTAGSEGKTIGEACEQRKVPFEHFLTALEELDWDKADGS